MAAMTDRTKKTLRARFFKALGPNAAAFKAMMDAAPLLCFYMKDAKGRIMALNRRNCDVCNIKDEWDAIGLRSDQIFPAPYAEDYMALDKEVLSTGKPVLQRVTEYPADRSMNFMISDVYPLHDSAGRIIGTARAYRLTSDTRADPGRYGHMRTVSRYIAEHYAESLNLNRLAELAGMSLSRFKRIFTATFNMSPGRYVSTIRLNAARQLLETSDLLVSDIATACGFYDQSHFTRAFIRERGVTPGAYRRQHGQGRCD
ncbi:MAG: helix-turn-helix domain-containing protein [Kiritimatiellae bacterium]|nr:helix-turn-helix domain-containing protein [Kiritimatiellia bacterium]